MSTNRAANRPEFIHVPPHTVCRILRIHRAPAITRSTMLAHSLLRATQLAATLFVAFATLWIPDASADGITLDTAPAEADRAATLARVWRSAIRDAMPELEHDEGADTTGKSWDEEFFCLRASRAAVDWGVLPPPLRLTGFTNLRYRNPIPTQVDVRIAPGEPLRLIAPKDLCLIDASARIEVSAATWQPSFACTPLDATRVRLNADVTYAWKSERRLTTSLGLTVAQLFRVGPYEAEVSSALRAHPEANVYDRTYRAQIKLPFPE